MATQLADEVRAVLEMRERALVTVDWELLRGDESVIREWRQSYNLARARRGWQILVSTFHLA